mmetsp:Transcript_3662/g.5408  ORF Transcript_3662/g.5408 Transcript_3662/m.5408 type:complete len:342 (+) Transcript_3662:31-1056(+)
MSTNQPPEKKQKADVTWRSKCISKFGLKEPPSTVPTGSEDAWKRYYKTRVKIEEDDARLEDEDYDSDGNSIAKEEDAEEVSELMWSWATYGMERLEKLMPEDCKWHWTPQRPKLGWDSDCKLQSADYYAHVWSPFAIPHAIKLYHSWYGKVGWSYSTLNTDYHYMLVDFEDSDEGGKYVQLCSFDDDVIKTSNLNKTAVAKLRKFLYGGNTKKIKQQTCSDKDFLLLLFGSMGSTDEHLEDDAKDACLGWTWVPSNDDDTKEMLFKLKAPEDDDENGVPPTTLGKYYPRRCSWLRYAILKAADALGPISKHYQPPPEKKASPTRGYDDSDSGGYSSDGYEW